MKKAKRGTPKRRKRAPARKRSAAVVGEVLREMPLGLANVSPAALATDPIITAGFVGTLQLSEQQIKALRRPVEDAEIEWKPAEKDGPPVIPYLSHNGYRDRLDEAFGLGGWGMVPLATPKEKDSTIYIPFALVVGGMPRVYAWGEQQLHKMSYGDGIEGAKSNAITRCGKELGIARDLWNRQFIQELKARKGKPPGQAKKDPPPRHGSDTHGNDPITEDQRLRLWKIAKSAGRAPTEVGMWLTARYGIDDSHTIKRSDYDQIIAAIERPGRLDPGDDEGGSYGR